MRESVEVLEKWCRISTFDSALLYIKERSYPLTSMSGSYSSGALFQTTIMLPSGNYSFYFVFSDTSRAPADSWADPFAPSTYAGPNIGANAKPVAPGTILSPSHDDDPDQLNTNWVGWNKQYRCTQNRLGILPQNIESVLYGPPALRNVGFNLCDDTYD